MPEVVTIGAIESRRIFNSHVQPTTEFTVRLSDGAAGRGASPVGETISIYEDGAADTDATPVIAAIAGDGLFDRPLDQARFDTYLATRMDDFGRNTCYALSLAFFEAVRATDRPGADAPTVALGEPPATPGDSPHLCLNILNGGRHAYTNPILSDFPEFLLVARSTDLDEVLGAHNELQHAVREALLRLSTTVVDRNPVHRFPAADNRASIEFLLGICDRLGLSGDFDLMIDASAGDLWSDGTYRFELTDRRARSPEDLCEYWLELVRDYPRLRFLEDPFRELDTARWTDLTTAQDTCRTIGDNLYSTSAERIEEGARRHQTDGVIIKPNQAGTVSAARAAIAAARRTGQIPITSHRSVSTETPFEATLTYEAAVPYIKIGPLLTDYSSVVRLNELIRLTGSG